MTIADQIRNKKSEAIAAWEEYAQALRIADENRDTVRKIRGAVFAKIKAGESPMIEDFVALRGFSETQAVLDAKEVELAKRFDQIGDKLAGLQPATK